MSTSPSVLDSVRPGARSGKDSNRSHRPPQMNIGIRVTGFDLSQPNGGAVEGVVVGGKLEGTQVKIRLTDAEETKNFRPADRYSEQDNARFLKKRPTPEAFHNGFKVGKGEVNPVPIGGLMLASGCVQKQGMWVAQYLDQYGRNADFDLRHGPARLYKDAGDDKRGPSAAIDLLYPQDAVMIKSEQALKDFFTEHFPATKGDVEHNSVSCFRLIEPAKAGEEPKAIAIWAYSAKEKKPYVKEGDTEPTMLSVAASSDASYSAFAIEGKQASGMGAVIAYALSDRTEPPPQASTPEAQRLVEAIRSGNVLVEGIPGERIRIIGQALEEVFDPETKFGKYSARFSFPVKEGEEGRAAKVGFVPTYVGIYTRRNDFNATKVLSKFSVDPFFNPMLTEQLWTPNFSLKSGLAIEHRAEAAAEAAPGAGIDFTADQHDLPLRDEPEAEAEAKLESPAPM